MKLKNKETGEIREFAYNEAYNEFRVYKSDGIFYKTYCSLAELCEEWSDYEEPADKIENIWTGNRRDKTVHIKCNSEEYAKEVLSKLKAWKRLEEKEFRFTGWRNGILLDKPIAGQVRYEFPIDNKDEIEKDLDLLFGGEE